MSKSRKDLVLSEMNKQKGIDNNQKQIVSDLFDMDNVDNVVIDEFVLDFPKKGFSQVALSVYFNERDSIQGVRHYIKQNLNGNHVIAPSNLPNQIDCYNFIIDNYNAGESNVVTAKVFLPSPLKKLTWPRSCPT